MADKSSSAVELDHMNQLDSLVSGSRPSNDNYSIFDKMGRQAPFEGQSSGFVEVDKLEHSDEEDDDGKSAVDVDAVLFKEHSVGSSSAIVVQRNTNGPFKGDSDMYSSNVYSKLSS